MDLRKATGIVAGVVLLASGAAHALTGWPPIRDALVANATPEGLVGAIGVGWYFGSVAMLAFGAIVLSAVPSGQHAERRPARVIAVAYLLFGSAAWVLRDFNSHFLVFIGTGAIVGAFAWLPKRDSAGSESVP